MTMSDEPGFAQRDDAAGEPSNAEANDRQDHGSGADSPMDSDVDAGSDAQPSVPDQDVVASGPGSTEATPSTSAAPAEDALPKDDAARALATQLETIAHTLEHLVTDSGRYHQRAEQREGVISALNSEIDLLRQGERRSLLFPLLSALIRLRDDLRRQADQLPAEYDRDRAAALLISYADEIEIALEDNGVRIESVQVGETFDARSHKGRAKKPAPDPDLAGTVAEVRSDRYVDQATGHVLSPATVVVFGDPLPQTTPDTSADKDTP